MKPLEAEFGLPKLGLLLQFGDVVVHGVSGVSIGGISRPAIKRIRHNYVYLNPNDNTVTLS